MDELIERFLREASNSSYITTDYLEEFCASEYRNIKSPTFGGVLFWDTVLERNNWKLQKHIITDHIRILDSENNQRAVGMEEEIFIPILSHIDECRKIDRMKRAGRLEYGIVFCGGGAKGAYQIGVWRYLQECGLAKKVTGVSGVSVGALNSILFAQEDLDAAEQIWYSIGNSDLLHPNEWFTKPIEFIGDKIDDIMTYGISPSEWITQPVEFIDDISSFGLTDALDMHSPIPFSEGRFSRLSFCSQSKIKDIIKKNISLDKIMRRDLLVYSTLTDWRLLKFPSAKYWCWEGRSYQDICKTVLGSAAFPMVYPVVKIDGREYIDGGAVDNCPIKPLIKAGFSHLIVVHLDNSEKGGKSQRKNSFVSSNPLSDVEFIHIWPRDSLGETFEISSELTFERFKMGYKDARFSISGNEDFF